MALAACAALVALGAAPAAAQDAQSWRLDFKVLRDGKPFGRHTLVFTHEGDDLVVDITIDLAVQLAFVPLFKYHHHNREVWRQGRLWSLETVTEDDGTDYAVHGQATEAGIEVTGAGAPYVAPAEAIPSSYWNHATLDQTALINTQFGDLMPISVNLVGQESIAAPEGPRLADHYRIDAKLPIDIWYDSEDGSWRKLAFKVRGSQVDYVQIPPPIVTDPAEERTGP